MSENKSHIVILQETAQQHTAKGEYDKAIVLWKKLLSIREDGNIYNTIGDLYVKRGDNKNAIEYFALAAGKFKKDGSHQKAMALYKKILNINPVDMNTLTALADLYASQGFENYAIDSFHKVAELHIKNGAAGKALEVYEKMLRLFPFNMHVKIKLSELYIQLGLRERAAQGYAVIAANYVDNEDTPKAMEFYHKALQTDPKNISSLVGLSKLAESSDDIDKALEYLGKAMALDPLDQNIVLSYAKLAIKTKRVDDTTKNALLKFIESNPGETMAKQYLGTVYLTEGLTMKAWEELQPCIDERVAQQDWEEAGELLNHFRELFPIQVKERLVTIYRAKGDAGNLKTELIELANLYMEEDSPQAALKLFMEVHEIAPDDADTVVWIKELEQVVADLRPEGHRETADFAVKEISVPESLAGSADAAQTGSAEERLYPEAEFGEHISIETEAPAQREDGDSSEREQSQPLVLQDVRPEDFQEKKAEADFYAGQGLKDEALQIYEQLLGIEPDNKEIQRRIEVIQTVQETEAVVQKDVVEAPEAFQEKKAEADFYAAQGMKGEALAIYEALLSAGPEDSGIMNRIESLKTLTETARPVIEPSPAEEISASPAVEDCVHRTDVEDSAAGLDEMLQGQAKTEAVSPNEEVLENPVKEFHVEDMPLTMSAGDPDTDVHYVSGVAFWDKGLLDDAIREFQIAAEKGEQTFLSLRMLALCYAKKKDYPAAVSEYRNALDLLSESDRRYFEIKYELADVCLKNSDIHNAFALYSEIYEENPKFRDISRKFNILKVQMNRIRGKGRMRKNRISYL